jgi:hypothetical protein
MTSVPLSQTLVKTHQRNNYGGLYTGNRNLKAVADNLGSDYCLLAGPPSLWNQYTRHISSSSTYF